MKGVNGVKTPNTFEECDKEDKKNMTMNAKANNVLTCALGKNEYSRVSSCSSTYELWKLSEMTHKRTSEVKKSKINLLISQYEKFEMANNESIGDMFFRINTILASLKSLSKLLTKAGIVQKATVIREAKDLDTLGLDQLMGSL